MLRGIRIGQRCSPAPGIPRWTSTSSLIVRKRPCETSAANVCRGNADPKRMIVRIGMADLNCTRSDGLVASPINVQTITFDSSDHPQCPHRVICCRQSTVTGPLLLKITTGLNLWINYLNQTTTFTSEPQIHCMIMKLVLWVIKNMDYFTFFYYCCFSSFINLNAHNTLNYPVCGESNPAKLNI